MTTHTPSQIGRYRIERELGRGTMGVVYQARDSTLGRTVALKTFSSMSAIAPHEREAFEQRFLTEARIAATLDDPSVVAVYDVGRDFETGLLFMALEYVRGETLADVLSRGPMPWVEAARIISKVAKALQTAHAHHIVHRDIKPANIMLTGSREPKIMDFGIAKASAAQLTIAGQVFGTPAYMSPEQAQGEDVDGRSDIFALGAVLYELITKTRPFEAGTMATTLTKILRDEPRPPSSLVRVPRTLDAVIGKALQKARNSRYDTATQFATDLDCVVSGRPPVHAAQLGPLETVALGASEIPRRAAPSPPAQGHAPTERNPLRSRTLRATRLAGAVALGVVLGVSVVLALREPNEPQPPPPASVSVMAPVKADTKPEPVIAVAPSAAPTPVSVISPGTVPLSVGRSSGRDGRITLELKHPFASGTLRVKVDERVVFANKVSGMPVKVMGALTGYDGRFGADFVIPPGEHIIKVEVRSGEAEFTESRRLFLRPGESLRLVALVGKTLTLTVE